MNNEQRIRLAIQHVTEKMADQRDNRQAKQDEQLERDVEDQAHAANRRAFPLMTDTAKPSLARALQHAEELDHDRDFDVDSDEEQARQVFGVPKSKDATDDDDDYLQ